MTRHLLAILSTTLPCLAQTTVSPIQEPNPTYSLSTSGCPGSAASR